MQIISDKIYHSLLLIAVLGFAVSGYLIHSHYNPDFGVPCPAGEEHGQSGCAIANSSEYSEIFGIPVALGGCIWFLILGYITYKARKNNAHIKHLLNLNILGIGSVFYFIYAEIMLKTICPYCTVVHVLIAISLGISIYLWKNLKNKKT